MNINAPPEQALLNPPCVVRFYPKERQQALPDWVRPAPKSESDAEPTAMSQPQPPSDTSEAAGHDVNRQEHWKQRALVSRAYAKILLGGGSLG